MQETDAESENKLDLVIQAAINTIPVDNKYFIALSGGLDSMALLYFALPYLQGNDAEVSAIHIHHGLSSGADDWAQHCKNACEFLGIKCFVEHVEVVNSGKGLEAAAREARYEVFARYLSEGGVLLQGHHQNDQAETVLLRMLRGSGPEGLAGIPQQRTLAAGQLFRPWLMTVQRSLLQQQTERLKFDWVEDESNSDLKYDRNFIRHQILPKLQERWPSVLGSLSRVSGRSRQAHEALTAWSKARLTELLSETYERDQALMLNVLAAYSLEEQNLLVRQWIDQLGIEHPPDNIFARIWSELIPAKASAQPQICWGQHCLRRYEDCLFYLLSADGDEEDFSYEVSLQAEMQTLELSLSQSILLLEFKSYGDKGKEQGERLRLPKGNERVVIRSRRGGEKFHMSGSQHSVALKKILQDHHIPPWQRQALPLIFYGDVLAYVGCGLIADGFKADDGQNSIQVLYPS